VPQDRLQGGAEQLLINLVTYLAENGEKCHVVFLLEKIYGDWEHLEKSCVIEYGTSRNVFKGFLSLIPRLRSISRKYQVGRSFTSQTLINSMIGFMKKLGYFKNTSVIVRESNSIFHLLSGAKLKRYILAYWIGYHGVDLVICQTEFMKDQLLKGMPWMKKKLKLIVLPNPIDMDAIREKEKIVLPELKHREFIIAAGRLVPAKGFDVLIESLKSLQQDFPRLELLILGEGPEREHLQEIIDSLELKDKAHLIGFVPNVYPYFRGATVCVLSSRIEGFPNVLLQMMSQNTKVVSTLSAGGIENLEGVFTCEIENEAGLTNAIKTCLLTDTNHYRSLFDAELEKRTVAAFLENTINNL
jgi:glycosyltransferase involved in cell wall biosynthesis